MIILPAAPFAELAFELRWLAWREAVGAEQLAVFAARNPDLPAVTRSAVDAKTSAERVGQAFQLFAGLAPHETEARRRLSSIVTGPGRAA